MKRLGRLAIIAGVLVGLGGARLSAQSVLVQRVPPPASADSAWRLVTACAGVRPTHGGDLADVKWVVGVWHTDEGIISIWQAPDTIMLMPVAYLSPLIVAHELMHHLLRGPGSDVDSEQYVNPHPAIFVRCQLMTYQYYDEIQGQIMRIVGLWPRPTVPR